MKLRKINIITVSKFKKLYCKNTMKKYLLILIAAFCSFSVNSQDTTTIISDSIDIDLINTQLLFAAEKGDADSVLILLKKGANVNAITYDGISALMYAAQKGHLKTVKTLVANGADINAKPFTYDATPILIAAVKFDHDSVAEYLILKGANIEQDDGYGAEPLIYAVAYNYKTMTDMLLFYKARTDCTDREMNSPLHLAAYYGYIDIVNILILRKADVNAVDYSGSTPLILAAQNGHTEIVDILLQNNANPDIVNNRGSTAYSTAIRNGNNDVIFKFLKNGADINNLSNVKCKPLEYAIMNNQKETADYLRENGAKNGLMPKFNTWSLGFGHEFNFDDFMYNFCLGWIDSRYKLGFEIDFSTRLWPTKVWYPIEKDVYEQRRERRSLISFTLDKRFNLSNLDNSKFGFAVGIREAYTYGKYMGYDTKVDDQWVTAPHIGLFIKGQIAFLKVNYSYLPFIDAETSPHRITTEICFLIRSKKSSPTNKTISWL